MPETPQLHFEDAVNEAQFAAMSLIHARGWRKSYKTRCPADYMAGVVTDDRWIPMFRADYESGNGRRGLLLFRGNTPVACATYGPARIGAEAHAGAVLQVQRRRLQGWGEVISFYADPDETDRGYGAVLMREVLRRLKASGFSRCYVLVLRKNEGARRFLHARGLPLGWHTRGDSLPPRHGLRRFALHAGALGSAAGPALPGRISARSGVCFAAAERRGARKCKQFGNTGASRCFSVPRVVYC
jgi:GNAT superfamily N-acetyltransferase